MPIKNRKSFEKTLKEAAQAYGKEKLKKVRVASFAAYDEILVGSPVLTGRFRSNWMISTKRENQETVTTSSKTFGQPTTQEEIQKGNDAVRQLGDDSALYISNNLPYAKRLEKGHSTQNQGFVARAERNFRKRLKAIDDLVVVE